jgi:GNAT superfamily N-acetyltransferase
MITYVGSENWKSFAPFLNEEALFAAKTTGTVVFGAIDDDSSCGAVAVLIEEYDAAILSLYVVPECRRRGHGGELLRKATALAKKAGVASISAAYELDEDGNSSLDGLFLANGFARDTEDESPSFTTTLGEMLSSKLFAGRISDKAQNVLYLRDVGYTCIQNFNVNIENSQYLLAPIDLSRIDPDVSTAAVVDGKMVGGIWISAAEDLLVINGVCFDPKYVKELLPSVRKAFYAAGKKYAHETRVSYLTINPDGEKLAKVLFPDMTFQEGTMHLMSLAFTGEPFVF